MKTESVEFQNKEGQVLTGRLEMPERKNPVAYAMFAHCFTCTKDYKSVTYISRTLAAHGFAVLPGVGSDGELANGKLEHVLFLSGAP